MYQSEFGRLRYAIKRGCRLNLKRWQGRHNTVNRVARRFYDQTRKWHNDDPEIKKRIQERSERIKLRLAEHHAERANKSDFNLRLTLGQRFLANPKLIEYDEEEQLARNAWIAMGGERGTFDLKSWQKAQIERDPSLLVSANAEAARLHRPPRSFVLTDDQVREARIDNANGVTYTEIAKRFNVGLTTVGNAVRGETYTHVIDVPPVPKRWTRELSSKNGQGY